jgi:hypothetical protein
MNAVALSVNENKEKRIERVQARKGEHNDVIRKTAGTAHGECSEVIRLK